MKGTPSGSFVSYVRHPRAGVRGKLKLKKLTKLKKVASYSASGAAVLIKA